LLDASKASANGTDEETSSNKSNKVDFYDVYEEQYRTRTGSSKNSLVLNQVLIAIDKKSRQSSPSWGEGKSFEG